MSDDKPIKRYNSRKGRLNRNSTTVRLALYNMDFDAVKEWVLAYRQLEDPDKKMARLETLMKFMFPQIKETDQASQEVIEMEQELSEIPHLNPSNMPTEYLLESVDSGQKNSK